MTEPHPLRAWRQARPLSQTQLGRLVGVGASQISQIESGQRGCSLEVAIKIRDLAGDGVPLESLVTREAAQ